MNLFDYFLNKKDGTCPALVTLSGTYTFSDLSIVSECIIGFLQNSGAQERDRALLVSDNNFFWVAAYLGILGAGLICVPLPPRISEHDLQTIVSTTQPRFCFLERKALPRIGHLLGATSIVCDQRVDENEQSCIVDLASIQVRYLGSHPELRDFAPDDIAALMFTSGSTGKPCGVMVSGGNIVANTESIIEYLSLSAKDRIMAVLPFHYCFGTSLLHTHLRVGASIVIEPRFMYPERVLQRLAETACTGFAGVPSHYQILLRRSNFKTMHFPHLRYMQQAGGHLAPVFVRELQEALPNTELFIMYGQTEATARLSYLPPHLLEKKLGSVGKGIPGVKLTVIDEQGRQVAPGQIGQIVAEGLNIAQGYWRDEQATATYFSDGKLYTGDMATVDQDGFIFIVGRAREFLKCGGKRISCRFIEDVLLECGLLTEAVVVGVPDETLGEAVMAFVVPCNDKSGNIPEDVLAFSRLHLPLSLVPKEVVVMDSLPKNSAGKVMKQNLREAVAPNVRTVTF